MHRKIVPLLLIALTAIILSACNLGAGNPAQETLQASTLTPTTLGLPTRTPPTTSGAPTTLPLTTNPTRINPQVPPTAIVVLPPTNRPLPTNTFVPVNIVILSPYYGNVVAGAVQVFGSATHPNFLQYQLEFGPDPNPSNLWYPATTASTVPVTNGILGFWNTSGVQDATYQLRLRVFLRDGTLLTTVVNNIRVQNRQATPIPSNTPLIERPIAAFNVDKSAGQVPLAINFTNQSSGQINTIQWNFGDGTGSTVANPSHTYATPGLYTVTLTVTGPGGSANVSRQVNAQSPSAPIAGFTMDRTSGVAPLTIQFTDQSTGTITGYLWNFLDGTTSTDRNPSHQFNLPGTYNILLTVTGPGGSSTASRQITVTSPIPPTLTFTPTFTFTPIPPTATWTPTNTDTPLPPTLTFTATNTDTPAPIPATNTPTLTPSSTETPPVSQFVWGVPDPANPLFVQFTNQSTGNIVSFQWDFGDGVKANDVNPLHQFNAPGTYLVTLFVTTASGMSAASQQNVTVVALPTATWTPSETPIPPTATSIPPTETPIPPSETPIPPSETPVPPTETPTQIPTETETPPVSQFVWDIPDPSNPLLVQFTSQASGNALSYFWNFGDGGSSNEIHPVRQYNAPGTYVVSLIVTSASGLSNESVQQVTVVAPPTAEPTETPPVAQFTFNVPDPANPLMVQFTNQSTGNIVSFQWNFGDGTGSNENNPNHQYSAPGTYIVSLIVTTASGLSNESVQQVTVVAPPTAEPTVAPTETETPPVSQFTFNVPDPANPLGVQFTNQSTGNIVSFQWDFGDGTTAGDVNPFHQFNAPGTYLVTLFVTTASGMSTSSQQQVTVVALPTAEPTATETPTIEPTVEPTTATPTLADTTLVLPDIGALAGNLMNIHSNGVNNFGVRSNVFTTAGDNLFESIHNAGIPILTPFATPGGYTLGENGDLQSIIDFYNGFTIEDGTTSFSHESVATGTGWRYYDLSEPSNGNSSLCSGQDPLTCELTLYRPAVMLINIGITDLGDMRDPNEFRQGLQTIIDTVVGNGTIPVLLTLPPRTDGIISQDELNALNEAIITAANDNSIPVINLYRALNELPGNGLSDGSSLSISPNGGGSLANGDVNNYGVNMANYVILRTLNALRTSIFP